MNRKFFFTLAVVLCICHWSYSQILSNIRHKIFADIADSLKIDTFALIPGETYVFVKGRPADTSDYRIFPFQSLLVWIKKPVDTISIRYRIYPFKTFEPLFNKNIAEYRESQQNFVMKPFEYKPPDKPSSFIDFGSIDYNGTFSRGIFLGNNQSVVLNSQFNLQLGGMLSDDLELTAALTDNNVPFQPEGNTQQIQEFDKIFIQLNYLNRHKILAGDFDLFQPEQSHFLRFSKKPRGGWYNGKFTTSKHGIIQTQVAGGIMRGKFARNILNVSEGNQGPYKLFGANGEAFILILANSEEVFINGQKVERGADRDYVIDYNTAEIRFTPRRIITRDLRVVVEFEYTNANYLRSVAFAHANWATKHVNLRLDAYSEQDSRNQTLAENLDERKRSFLRSVGDSADKFLFPTIDSVAPSPNKILYALKDTLGYDSVLVFSNSPEAFYTATFSIVGDGNGDYIPAISTANGRVFAWVKPDTLNGVVLRRGNYAPAILLASPQLQQMFSASADFKIHTQHTVSTEVSLSHKDLNTFSKINNNDNVGAAARIQYNGTIPIAKDSALGENISVDASYEFVQRRFRFVERFRAVEFNREWNTTAFINPFDEHYANIGIHYRRRKNTALFYRLRNFIQQRNFNGIENSIGASTRWKSFMLDMKNIVMYADAAENKSLFIRPFTEFAYAFKRANNLRLGMVIDHEFNYITQKSNELLSSNAYIWQNYGLYLKSADTSRNQIGFEARLRTEQKPGARQFETPFFYGQTLSFTGRIISFKNQTLNWVATYRYAYNRDSMRSANYTPHFYLGRIDYRFTVLNSLINSATLYELSSGREQRIQLTYQKSPTNTGDYVWRDANGDGLKQLDEFVISPFREDTTYIKVFSVTPESVPVNVVIFTQSFNINPAQLKVNSPSRLMNFIKRFALTATAEWQQKNYATRSAPKSNIFNPFPSTLSDSLLVSAGNLTRVTLFFNRLESKYGAQFDFNTVQNKVLLTNGYEERLTQTTQLTLRYNLIQPLTLQTVYAYGIKGNNSDFFRQQRFRFSLHQSSTELSYQYKTDLRIALSYLFASKNNPTDSFGRQKATIHQPQIQARYNITSKAVAEARFFYSMVRYNDRGLKNQQLEFAMLEGLQNGNNLVWNATVEYRINPAIVLTVVYDG
ncbi:MAG: hypothetical protein NZ522_01505, partial [Chitinophagales bacterium]|nr:hypothetical protein [Chitinophagales bacterium]